MVPIIGTIAMLILIFGFIRLSYIVGYNRGHTDGVYDLEMRVNSALRLAIKDMEVNKHDKHSKVRP
jgi:hypothetical protein